MNFSCWSLPGSSRKNVNIRRSKSKWVPSCWSWPGSSIKRSKKNVSIRSSNSESKSVPPASTARLTNQFEVLKARPRKTVRFLDEVTEIKPEPEQQSIDINNQNMEGVLKDVEKAPENFTLEELIDATDNFSSARILAADGGSGTVFRGFLAKNLRVAAIKKLERRGKKGGVEFTVEVATLSMLRHPNIVELMGYCVEGEERLVVYEYMTLASLNRHLFDSDLPPERKPLDWNTRMSIAAGAAKGLVYLHTKRGMVYGNFNCYNILLNEDYHPKLSDFVYARVGPSDGRTFESDVYDLGVVILGLITGRKSFDHRRRLVEQDLVTWARPFLLNKNHLPRLIDPRMGDGYDVEGFRLAAFIASKCVCEQPTRQSGVTQVAGALEYVAAKKYDRMDPVGSSTASSSKTCMLHDADRETLEHWIAGM